MEVGGRRYAIRFCSRCRLGVTDPFLDEKKLRAIYSSTYREEDSTRFFSPLERLIKVVRVQRARRVERYSVKGRILDVGCGRGDFPALMASRGWKATGLELDERIENRGRGIEGLELKAGSLSDVSFPAEDFDAMTMWHVFEHMRDPVGVMAECRRIIRPGGLLVLAVPNVRSLQARLTGRNWFHLDPPFHLYHYSVEHIRKLMEDAGFEVLSVKHFSLEYNPYGFLQSIFNSLGFRTNLFYDFLRSKSGRGAKTLLSIGIMVLAMPVVLPLSFALSLAEAAMGRGGTVEVYARKKG
ncbi:MAG: class I SAM-dependent methyltransferase [Thermodesulfobacteriota bacterium]